MMGRYKELRILMLAVVFLLVFAAVLPIVAQDVTPEPDVVEVMDDGGTVLPGISVALYERIVTVLTVITIAAIGGFVSYAALTQKAVHNGLSPDLLEKLLPAMIFGGSLSQMTGTTVDDEALKLLGKRAGYEVIADPNGGFTFRIAQRE